MTTKERLLQAGCRVFAEKGFGDATVAEICRNARANIAAVNYHFGSKEALYKQAWQYAHRSVLEAHPPDGGVSADAAPEDRLRGRIRAMLQRALSNEGLEFQIMSHEVAAPTGLLGQVFHDAIRPLREQTESIVRELLGSEADADAVSLCATSVIGPCLHVLRAQHMHRRLRHVSRIRPEMLDALVEHFTTFALGGVEAVRRSRLHEPARSRTKGADR